MPHESLVVSATDNPAQVRLPDGRTTDVPKGWILVPPGDPALTRRIKKGGPTFSMVEIVGRKRFSKGVWAPEATVREIERSLVSERADPAYQRKLDSAREKRAMDQELYEGAFRTAIVSFLAFHPNYRQVARTLARLVSEHAIPVGSGSVARNKTLTLSQRAESATIAWMRHQTTEYDLMKIPSEKGSRGQVRGHIAEASRALIEHYRAGHRVDPETCPLQIALRREGALSDPFE